MSANNRPLLSAERSKASRQDEPSMRQSVRKTGSGFAFARSGVFTNNEPALTMPATIPANLLRKLDELDAQHRALEDQLLDPAVLVDHRQVRALSIKKAAIEPL